VGATTEQSTLLKLLLTQRHWQKFETFRVEYLRTAHRLAPELASTSPSKSQFYRWLSGQLKGGIPYPDACRVLEAMFPPWRAEELFCPPVDAAMDSLRLVSPPRDQIAARPPFLDDVPPGFDAHRLTGFWVTSYQFRHGGESLCHADIAGVVPQTPRRVRITNHSPEPRTQERSIPFRNEIDVQLVGRHLIGLWRNVNVIRYFGTVQLAVLTRETVMDGYYTNFAEELRVGASRWKWVRLDPNSLQDVDLARVSLRPPEEVFAVVMSHSEYDELLDLEAVAQHL
jgi:hypothetical protein